MSEEREDRGRFELLDATGSVETPDGRIDVCVAVYVDTSGKQDKRGDPMIRVLRVTERKGGDKAKALTSYKTPEEVEGVAPLLLKAAKALAKALKAGK